MTRSTIRLIRFGSAKTLTRSVDVGTHQEPEAPELLYTP